MLIATIDSGTTNSRVRVWQDGRVRAAAQCAVGVRDTATTGSTLALRQGLKQALKDAAAACGAAPEDLDLRVASGMITSNLGLVELPHLSAPAGLTELATAMQAVVVPDVAAQPIWFVPGVKNAAAASAGSGEPTAFSADATSATPTLLAKGLTDIDFMRGEEVEAMALVHSLGLSAGALLLLPGSHNKLIVVDDQGRITRCRTTLSGELVAVLTEHTVLASALGGQYAETLDEVWLTRGAELSRREGLSRAAFSVRALTLMAQVPPQQAASFLLGAVLAQDMLALPALALPPDLPVILAGSSVVPAALFCLLRNDSLWRDRARLLPREHCRELAGQGALLAAARRGLIPTPLFTKDSNP